MKQYSITFLLASALTLGSCSDFLDRDPLSQASENTFWQTEADAQTGVNALYPLLPDSRDFWRDCQSDNSLMTNAWGEGGLGYICQGSHNAATGYLSEEWRYGDIRRILYYLDRLKDMDIDEAKKKRFEGEARFILALRYYRMTRHFGDIPLIKEKPIDLDEAALPRSPKQEVLDYALENVNKAIDYLPETYTNDNIGRITKGAALTLKADMYLDMASYAKFHKGQDATELWKEAALAAKQVIDLKMISPIYSRPKQIITTKKLYWLFNIKKMRRHICCQFSRLPQEPVLPGRDGQVSAQLVNWSILMKQQRVKLFMNPICMIRITHGKTEMPV